MIRVSENIRYLRKKMGYTQEQFAELIGIKRSLVGAYEEGRADPRLNNLLKMADVFQVTLDELISQNVSILDKRTEQESDGGQKTRPPMKILSITVDKADKENIEFIPQKASAGYLNGYADPEYLEELPKFNLPNLPGNATYRAFEIQGDSMLPLTSGTVIIGKYVEAVDQIRNGKTYVFVTRQEGVVYKRAFNYIEEKGKIYLVSDNKAYSAYNVSPDDILEIWEAKAFVSLQFPEPNGKSELSFDQLSEIVLSLQHEVIKIKDRIDN